MGYIQTDLSRKSTTAEGIEGTVIVKFTIDKTGQVKDIIILSGLSDEINKEVIRVISSSPKWEPGYLNGEPVNVWYTMPVLFKLEAAKYDDYWKESQRNQYRDGRFF